MKHLLKNSISLIVVIALIFNLFCIGVLAVDTQTTATNVLIEDFSDCTVNTAYANATINSGWSSSRALADVNSTIVDRGNGNLAFKYSTTNLKGGATTASWNLMYGIQTASVIEAAATDYIAFYMEVHNSETTKINFALQKDYETAVMNPDSYTEAAKLISLDGTETSVNYGWTMEVPANFKGYIALPVAAFSNYASFNKIMIFTGRNATTQKVLDFVLDDFYLVKDLAGFKEDMKPAYYALEDFNSGVAGNDFANKFTNTNWSGKTNDNVASTLIQESAGDLAYQFTTDAVNGNYTQMTGVMFATTNIGAGKYIAVHFAHDSDAAIKLEFVLQKDYEEVKLNHAAYDADKSVYNGYLVTDAGVSTTFNCNWKVSIPAKYSGWVILPAEAFGCITANKFMLFARNDDATVQKKITYTWDDLSLINNIEAFFEYCGVAIDWFTQKTPVTNYDYSFAIVGDTQCVNDYDQGDMHYIYDWILANQESKKINFVFGLGDITNESQPLDTQTDPEILADIEGQWQVAQEQIFRLNGKVPYSLTRGNHDSSIKFNQYFGVDAYKDMFDGFKSEDRINESYITFKAGSVDYLNITLDYGPNDEALAWASEIIEAHPNHRVIITTHGYLYSDGTTIDDGDEDAIPHTMANNGQEVWDKLIKKHENIFMVLSGHVTTDNVVVSQVRGEKGNAITQILVDPQSFDWKTTPNACMVAMLYFSNDGKTVSVEYLSTSSGKYYLKENQFDFDITAPDVEIVPEVKNELIEDFSGCTANTSYNKAVIDSNWSSSRSLTDVVSSIIDRGKGDLAFKYTTTNMKAGVETTSWNLMYGIQTSKTIEAAATDYIAFYMELDNPNAVNINFALRKDWESSSMSPDSYGTPITLIDAFGTVSTVNFAYTIAFPANFKGYVVLPAAAFSNYASFNKIMIFTGRNPNSHVAFDIVLDDFYLVGDLEAYKASVVKKPAYVVLDDFNDGTVNKVTNGNWSGKTNDDVVSSIINQGVKDKAYEFTTDAVNGNYSHMTGVGFNTVELGDENYIAVHFEHNSDAAIKLEFALQKDWDEIRLHHAAYDANHSDVYSGYLVADDGTQTSFFCDWQVTIPANYSGWVILPAKAFGLTSANKFMLFARNDGPTTQKEMTYVWDDLYFVNNIEEFLDYAKNPEFENGDINHDGYINDADLELLRLYLSDLEVGTIYPDVTGDKAINAKDIAKLKSILALING